MRTHAYGVFVCIGALTLCCQQTVIARSDEKRSEPAKADPAPDLSKFPKLQGKVEQVLGGFVTFAPPKAGDSFQLELKEVLQLKTLSFNEGKGHIHLPGPVVVESIHHYSNGAFHSMRLISKKESRSVTIDVGPAPSTGPKRVRVWVVAQSQVVEAVALIECEYEGAFPDRAK